MKDYIYAFVGEDDFLIKNEVDQLVKKLKVEAFNVLTYDLEELELYEFLQEITTVSLLSDKKVIKVKNAWFFYEDRGENLQSLIHYFQNPKTDTTLIFLLKKDVDSNFLISREAKKYIRFEVVDKMEEKDFYPYIKNYFAELKYQISDEAINELIDRVNYDFNSLYNEIEKLKLFAYDDRKITLKDINLLVPRNLEDNIFELSNAIIAKNKRKALEIYYDLLTKNETPVNLILNISYKLKEIITTKHLLDQGYNEKSIMDYFNVSKGRAYYMIKNANSMAMPQLKKYYDTLADLDFKIKSGEMEPKLGLELWLLGG